MVKKNRVLTKEECKKIVEMYQREISPTDISRQIYTYHKTVIKVLQDNGLHFYVNKVTDDLKESIISDYTEDYMTITEISDKYLIKRDAVSHFLKKSVVYRGNDNGFQKDDIEYLRTHYPTDSWENIMSHFPNKKKNAITAVASRYGIRRNVDIWSDDEIETLKTAYESKLPINEICKLLPNRNYRAIVSKARMLGIAKERQWSDYECDILREHYLNDPMDIMLKLLPNRTEYSIVSRARKLGIYSPTYAHPWNKDEDKYLKDNWAILPDIILGEHIGRSRQAVKERRYCLGLYRQDPNKKTYPTLSKYIRGQLWEWKNASMSNCNWKCVLTGSKEFEIHHLYGVSNIISDIIFKYHIKEKPIDEYTQNELDYITQMFLDEQSKHPLGVCIRKDIHVLFHKLYGQYYNTPEQWHQFVKDYSCGVYEKYILENKIA